MQSRAFQVRRMIVNSNVKARFSKRAFRHLKIARVRIVIADAMVKSAERNQNAAHQQFVRAALTARAAITMRLNVVSFESRFT